MHARSIVATPLLFALNLAVFILELRAGDALPGLIARWGLVPADVSAALHGAPGAGPGVLVTLVTSAFLHAGWAHLAVNLAYLAVFGAAVEAAVGLRRFLGLYLAGAAIGGLAQVLAQPDATTPVVGASAAIAALIAGYLALFPGATLASLAPVLFVSPAANVPALLLLVIWVVAQVFSGVASIASASGVAWWAHVGGFAVGLAAAPVLRRRKRIRW